MRNAFLCLTTAVLLAGLAPLSSGRAGTVTVTAAQGLISVDANDANLDEVLAKLGEQQGFKIRSTGKSQSADTISGQFEGTLAAVLARILHNESHMIMHSASAKAGIAQIVLFNAGNSAPAAATGQQMGYQVPPPAAKTRSSAPIQPLAQPRPLAREVIPPVSRVPPQRNLRGGAVG